ncbi:ring-cleaving dioxygenase [Acidisphaera sp. L21]|jgi:glyoxalase family protein|uniref:ring-cleaving dioxygenase n=1 Tax=Acidisphaera sp. L21 TaxID=1641851 RepID=UPI00131BB827|nr:ring-cleaving dioxygenase [Acidisphaera sp. L21]
MQLSGIHHLTAISSDASGNHAFYTGMLGMRLVKKTVNQDDTTAYHLFYADAEGRPGTDLTFFDWPTAPERRGTGSVVRTALRVASGEALSWWLGRFATAGIPTRQVREDGRDGLALQDAEGQRLLLLDDGGIGDARPWSGSPVPAAYQIRGLGPITICIREMAPTETFLVDILGMRRDRDFLAADGGTTTVFAMGQGGPTAELHVRVEPKLPAARQGAGGVHHVAFRIPDAAYDEWVDRLRRLGVRFSGPVDRFYFRSLYAREPGGILCEIATDGPGFTADEPADQLGSKLALPPFLEPRRAAIEAGLKPL